jgi:hemerythrin
MISLIKEHEMYTPKELHWKNEMTTGVVELDAQHKFLIDTFNDLGHSIGGRFDPEDINKVMKVMKFYVEWHFGKEEECMARFHYPVAEKNHKAHAVFTKKLREYQKEFEQSGGSLELAIKIHEELTDWISNHILVVDTQLYPFSQ